MSSEFDQRMRPVHMALGAQDQINFLIEAACEGMGEPVPPTNAEAFMLFVRRAARKIGSSNDKNRLELAIYRGVAKRIINNEIAERLVSEL